MAKYVYPAVFTREENGLYSVVFPDLESCYTCGNNLEDAIAMAEDVLAFTLFDYEKENKKIPSPSLSSEISINKDEFVNFIRCDTIEYQKRTNTKAVRKTLSIPEWLNTAAEKAGINFSQILQEALKLKLGVA